jgi:AmmeMemoRadiSam system protein B
MRAGWSRHCVFTCTPLLYTEGMPSSAYKPSLRPVETLVVPDTEHGQVLVLRDTQGVTSAHACIPPALIPIVARFNGERTCGEIAREASGELGQTVTTAEVERIAAELEKALFLEGALYRAALDEVRKTFREATTRPAVHAGAAYSADAGELMTYLNDRCLAHGATSSPSKTGKVLDPWRGAVGYGHAYAALRDGLPEEADTFVVFGTSHAPMQEPFALCRKGFDTPLGAIPADLDAIDRIARKCPYDPYADELNHKREHSIEFQAVFLKHVLGSRPARIIPILAGLGRQQARGTDPGRDAHAMALLDAVRDLVHQRGRRVVVVAGADMAHVGPRFGDPLALGAELREELERKDGASLALAAKGDATGFWEHVAADLETRRVCGLAPMYAMLRTMQEGASGDVRHYEQTIDADDGSIVSHAAIAFYA